MKTLLGFVLVLLGANASLRADDQAVIVHEWGTFTCLQDEQGQAIGGINVDDEPVPNFVEGSGHVRRLSGRDWYGGLFGLPPNTVRSKGWNPADSDVTMRLETPVLYLYPPQGQAPRSVPPLDVHVDFHGGVLSQYYPYAEGQGFPDFEYKIPWPSHLSDMTTGLTWKGVRLGSTEKPVETSDPVWTTPRAVGAPLLEVQAPIYVEGNRQMVPQAEHFLFYRGIGHLDSPLFLKMPFVTGIPLHSEEAGLEIAPRNEADEIALKAVYDQVWAVKILANGACGFTTLSAVTCAGTPPWRPINAIDSSFDTAKSPCTVENLAKLKASMHDALVKEGLYDDEATAMLKTWELSYFKSPGLRFFYIVPRAWVDKELPLTITGAPTEITRVMVGRIELISDAQKSILARLASGPCPDIQALKVQGDAALTKSNLSDAAKEPYYSGAKPLTDFAIAVPPLVQDYLSLGRFRDALIVHEQQQHPSAVLAQFIKDNQLADPPH